MAVSQAQSKRKSTGGLNSTYRKKKKHELGRQPGLTKIGAKRVTKIKARSGIQKFRLLSAEVVNLYNPKTKKYESAKVKNIVENTANRHFVRRNIMTKGCVIETEKGKAKVTSRPGQDGMINAVLI